MISTYIPDGNIERCDQLYGIAQNLLRITEEMRGLSGVPFLSNSRVMDEGDSFIEVLASQYSNSIIKIYSEFGGGERKTRVRQRLLHCRIELTLAEDVPTDIDTDDGSIGWPYQKDPAFIAVEPIPVSDRIVTLHVLFEVDKRSCLVLEGLNGAEHIDRPKTDPYKVKKGDEGSVMTMEQSQIFIEMYTGYRLVKKITDGDDAVVPVYTLNNRIVPANADGIDLKALLDSSVMTHHTETVELEGYNYMTHFDGDIRIMSNSARRSLEPFETFLSPYIFEDEEKTEKGHLHSTFSVGSYIDTIEEAESADDPNTLTVSEFNIHPLGSINHAALRHCYGIVGVEASPFNSVNSDFVPRKNDKVFIGDIGITANRNKTTWFTVIDDDGKLQYIYNDAKLTATIFPYHIEAKEAEAIASEFESLEVGWNYYSRHPTKYVISGPPRDDDGEPVTDYFYVPWSANWFFHPYRNESWPAYLRDFFTRADGDSEVENNIFFAHTEMMINPEYTYADIPNRMILCIRSFFANTENATTVSGVRRSYDIEYPSVLVDGGGYGNRPYRRGLESNDTFNVPGTYDEVPVETSPPLSVENSPNFVTVKGDIVVTKLLSSIYAVCDFPGVTEGRIALSPRHEPIDLIESSPTPVPTITAKRPWPAVLDGDWKYTNIYGAGVTVGLASTYNNTFLVFNQPGKDKRAINYTPPHKYFERATRGESIYSDADEDVSLRYIPDESLMEDVTWREEDTPESHIIHSIYRALEKEGYDKHHPVCDIKLETDLYDQYIEQR